MIRQSHPPVILLTRPLAQSQRFSAEITSVLGEIRVVISPLMKPEFLTPDLPDRAFSATIFASETAVAAAERHSARATLPHHAYCVGEQTARAAQAAGFAALSADGDSSDLVELVLAQEPRGPLLFVRGEISTGAIAEHLISAGIETISVVLYRQVAGRLTSKAKGVLRDADPVILPLFSPRSAALMVDAVAQLDCRAPIHVVALSEAVAERGQALKPASMTIARAPDAAAMVAAVTALIGPGRAS